MPRCELPVNWWTEGCRLLSPAGVNLSQAIGCLRCANWWRQGNVSSAWNMDALPLEKRWGMGLLCARLPCLLDEALDWNLSAVLGLQF